MPTLDWIGKKAVLNHHNEIPYRLLKCDPKLSVGEPGSGNLLIQGDNLEALKALLPYYAGQVKCIYIDPPYNTGNENWVYNDAVNSPEMRAWLGKAVGKEAEDLSRHDKWLCMMYPRLALMRHFLRADGLIFVNLDDTESAHARCLMDEIFGARNFLAAIAWEKRYTRSNNAKLFYSLKDTILVYRKSDTLTDLREPRTDKSDSIYKNPDHDPRGAWTTSSYVNPATKAQRPNLVYDILNPNTHKQVRHPTHAWKYERAQHQEHVSENRLWWGSNGRAKYPRLKNFLGQNQRGLVPVDIWTYEDSGTTDEGGAEIKSIFGSAAFDNPKPTKLIQRILNLGSDADSLILDAFAGSGTTGHAVLSLNKQDGGRRRFVLIEMDSEISRNVTSARLRNAVQGYDRKANGGNAESVEGLDGGFRYCELSATLFGPDGQIRSEVSFEELANHVFFTETGEPRPSAKKGKSAMLGAVNGVAVYLLYNGILKDKALNGGNVLTDRTLRELTPHGGPRVIFGTACRLSAKRLKAEGITFRQIPYEVKVR